MLSPQEDKFFARELVMGQAAEGAHGLNAALGMTYTYIGAWLGSSILALGTYWRHLHILALGM